MRNSLNTNFRIKTDIKLQLVNLTESSFKMKVWHDYGSLNHYFIKKQLRTLCKILKPSLKRNLTNITIPMTILSTSLYKNANISWFKSFSSFPQYYPHFLQCIWYVIHWNIAWKINKLIVQVYTRSSRHNLFKMLISHNRFCFTIEFYTQFSQQSI